jgi:hypothetical protein
MIVKDNHRVLHRKLLSFFQSPGLYEAEFSRARQSNIGHGRVECRSIVLSDDVPRGFSKSTGFAGVRQLFFLERHVRFKGGKRAGEEYTEVVVGMTSLPRSLASPAHLLSLIRGHWSIESLHYVRDVTFLEDASQVRTGNIPQTMVLFRNAVIGLVRVAGWQNVAAARRYFAANPHEALRLMGSQIHNEQ